MDPHRPKTSHSGETRFHYSKPNYAQPSQYQQFPPHPSVRVPPNVKLSARQVPAGVGVAPPPVRFDSPARPQLTPRSDGNGMLIQDFKFPAAPPIPASGSTRSRQEPWQSTARKYNMHDSYMSSVVNDYTPGTTPGSKSRGFPTPTSRRYSGSLYAESEALGYEERYDSSADSPETDATYSPQVSQQVVRQASLGKRARPALTTIRNRDSQLEQDIPKNFPAPPTQYSRKETMEALSAAVAAGMSGQPHVGSGSGTPLSRNHTPLRMPFDSSPPASPSADREFLQTPKTPNTVVSSKMLGHKPSSAHSQRSTNPLLGLGIDQPSMSDKIPANRRPPKLDMGAVRDAEARGSTTSLSDLIRRATKLAANLDRGKTASRLGMLDMFGSSEKLGMGGAANRHSTMSDMLSAFPAPAIGGTPTTKRDTAWPLDEKGEPYASTTDLSRGRPRKQRRKFCGLTLPILILVLTIIIILIAAAVLIPIFLILVPRQHKNSNSLSDCASSHPCRNGGFSIVSNNACVCVCSNGFTGSNCETSGNADDCMTITLKDGDTEYKNATIGSSVLPSFSTAQTRFDIPLNVSTILSVFSSSNLSCSSENSVVDFNSSALNSRSKTKRFIALPGLEPQPPTVDINPRPPQITARAEADCSKEHFERRQDGESAGTTTSNGIVFAQSSLTIGAINPTLPVVTDVSTVTSESGSTSSTASVTRSTSESSSATSSSTRPSATVTDEELEFAKVVVLYVLQESLTVSVAVNAQQRMEAFFAQQTPGNSTAKVDVGLGNLVLTANFVEFSITNGNGVAVGGKGSGSR